MAKNSIALAPDLRSDRPRRKLLPILSAVVLGPLLAPIILDTVALCYGQWSAMLGRPAAVRTPTLDAIGERIGAVRDDVWYHVSSRFQRVPWNPRVVLPIAVMVMVVAMVMLRL
jgi:hypothetical protein